MVIRRVPAVAVVAAAAQSCCPAKHATTAVYYYSKTLFGHTVRTVHTKKDAQDCFDSVELAKEENSFCV